MIAGDPNARAVSFLLAGRPRAAQPDRRRAAAAGHRRQDRSRRTTLPAPIVGTQDDDGPYGATFDALNIWEFDVKWDADPDRVDRAQGAAAGRGVRLDLPVRADGPRLPAAAGHHQPGPVPRHPVLPAAADLAARLPQLRRPRDDGDQPVGRGAPRPRPECAGTRSGATTTAVYSVHQQGTYAPGRRRPPLDGQHRDGQEGQHGPRLQRRQRHRRLPGHPLHGPPRRRPARPDDARRGQ